MEIWQSVETLCNEKKKNIIRELLVIIVYAYKNSPQTKTCFFKSNIKSYILHWLERMLICKCRNVYRAKDLRVLSRVVKFLSLGMQVKSHICPVACILLN